MNTHSSGYRARNLRSIAAVSKLTLAALLCVFAASRATAQDIRIGVTYACSGEKIFAENCNIRDTSDTSTCMMGHPDTIMPNGLMKYTYMTRGDLKKLLPHLRSAFGQAGCRSRCIPEKAAGPLQRQ